MAKSLAELKNENKTITKQLSKCAVNESIISKNYKKLNTKYEKILEENKQIKNSEQFNKVLDIIPKIKSVLESCKIVDKELQECKNDKYLHYSDSQTNKDIIPYGYGTWVYDKIFRDKDDTSPLPDGTLQIKPGNFVKPGLFKDTITEWNQKATAFPYTQVYSYGGDIEMYCRGSGESKTSDPCIKANGFKSDKGLKDGFVVTFPGDDKDQHIGLKSLEAYLNIPKVAQNILIIDGRMDNIIEKEDDYFNTLEKDEAEAFADIVSFNICQNNYVDGVQFDVEPFSFTGEGGSVSGSGQKYFYYQIAKNFAGWNGNANDNTGINPNLTNDPFGCVNANHPNGRFFSIFTFAKSITSDVKTMLTQYSNGCVMDSLYDLGPLPGGSTKFSRRL